MNQPNGELIIYQTSDGNIKIDVRLSDDTVWLSQAQLCELFQKSKATISEHIKNVFEEGELDSLATVRNFRTVQTEGIRAVERQIDYYNLDVIISVGYRVKSPQGTQFRIWATQRLKEYIIKGFVLNDDRFKAGNSMNYFTELQERIREIRLSEKIYKNIQGTGRCIFRIESIRMQSWDYGKNAAYHVTICTQYKADLFGQVVDKIFFKLF